MDYTQILKGLGKVLTVAIAGAATGAGAAAQQGGGENAVIAGAISGAVTALGGLFIQKPSLGQ